ncbi:MAG: 4Fe-4S binding protein [Lewinella sp.]|nr:4Fe-4S binding protein [Lewinella sp.]
MPSKSTPKNLTQYLGIGLFVFALAVFVASLTLSHYEIDIATVKQELNNDYYNQFVEQNRGMIEGKTFSSSFAFLDAFDDFMKKIQADIKQDVTEVKGLTTSDGEYWSSILQDWQLSGLRFPVAKASSTGLLPGHMGWFFFLSIILGILGALLYILPQQRFLPGIKNHHIYHSSMHHRGWLGIATGVFLIGFYVLLYFYPEHMVNWVLLVDPVSMALKGQPADNWFLYGFLYTIAILVMGIRMIIKYRHNRYQMIRTGSVMFFQLCFAFMLPEIMTALHQPSMDLKNIWPLNYSFFFDYNLSKLTSSGFFGLFLLFWGILLSAVAVPVITYFYGKRWYCSWVCGCGGLAETLGDPYRQLSDKTTAAWQIERWTIHSVLVFATAMTLIVIYSYLPTAADTEGWLHKTNFVYLASLLLIAGPAYVYWRNRQARVFSPVVMLLMGVVALSLLIILNYQHFILENYRVNIRLNRWLIIGLAAVVIGGLVVLHRRQHPSMSGRRVFQTAAVFFLAIASWQLLGYSDTGKAAVSFNQFDVRSIYGFAISSIFAGVVGTGFYPLMGNRVWCRFGCPLAAYLGLVQRLKSRFRITTNGGQCISCGNCSTYCEMGIDVRAYAQRGQDIVRSSCVGCGICSAVCPRGVLRLENSSIDIDTRAAELRALHVREEGVELVQ